MINPPGVPKSIFVSGPARAEDPMQWADAAQPTRREGS
jgi:hypothetical protein